MTDFPSADDLSKLSTAQLIVLHEVIAVESLITGWHVELGQLILAELEQRVAEQAIVNAKAAAIEAEEMRLARETAGTFDAARLWAD